MHAGGDGSQEVSAKLGGYEMRGGGMNGEAHQDLLSARQDLMDARAGEPGAGQPGARQPGARQPGAGPAVERAEWHGLNGLAAGFGYALFVYFGRATAPDPRVTRAARVTTPVRAAGQPVDEALLPHVAPLGWAHITLTGDYRWRSSERLPPGASRQQLLPELYKPELQIAEMDRRKIDLAAVSPSPALFQYQLGREEGADFHQMVNDGIAELVATHPGRYVGLAAVPLQAEVPPFDRLSDSARPRGRALVWSPRVAVGA